MLFELILRQDVWFRDLSGSRLQGFSDLDFDVLRKLLYLQCWSGQVPSYPSSSPCCCASSSGRINSHFKLCVFFFFLLMVNLSSVSALTFYHNSSSTLAQVVSTLANAVTSALAQVCSKRVIHGIEPQRSFNSTPKSLSIETAPSRADVAFHQSVER